MMLKAALITIIMLVIVALIISAANDYRAGRIRIRFDEEDHICEQCCEVIPVDHPCNCQKCWNDLVADWRKKIDELDNYRAEKIRLFQEIENLARKMETFNRNERLNYWIISLRNIFKNPNQCDHHIDHLIFDDCDRLWRFCTECGRKEIANK